MSDQQRESATGGPGWRTQLGIGVALLLVAIVIGFDAQSLRAPSTVGVGPSAAMRLVAVIVAVLAVAHWIAAWRQRSRVLSGQQSDGTTTHGNRASLAWVLGALLGLIAILEVGGGFILASTWLFVGTARGFGERLSPKSLLIGLALSAVVYIFFTKTLSLGLPAGPLERLLG